MAWGLIILIVLAIGIAIWTSCEACYGFELGPTLMLSVLYSLVAGIIWFVVGIGCIASPVETYPAPESEKVEIYSLADGNLTDGRHSFLGSGYIDEELQYTFVVKDELGYTVEQVKAKNCYVKYTQEDPYALPLYKKYGAFAKFWLGNDTASTDAYVFYLPEGTIIQEYNIDLK